MGNCVTARSHPPQEETTMRKSYQQANTQPTDANYKTEVPFSSEGLTFEVHCNPIKKLEKAQSEDTKSTPCFQQKIGQLSEEKNHEHRIPAQIAIKLPKEVSWDSFNIVGRIGKGAFADVFLAELKTQPEQRFAIKRMRKTVIHKHQLCEGVRLQKKIMEESVSNFITPLYSAFTDEHYYYMVMRVAEKGDSFVFVRPENPEAHLFQNLGESAIRFILACIVLGLEYLHLRNIVYFDLKPQNIVIDSDGYARLVDFGLAKEIKSGTNVCFVKTGTPLYYSPETVLGKRSGKEIDLWSLGVFAYELANCDVPFKLEDIQYKNTFRRVVLEAEKNREWSTDRSHQLKDLVNRLLKLQPKERLGAQTIRDIKNHRFFAPINWRQLEQKALRSPLTPILSELRLNIEPFTLSMVPELPVCQGKLAKEIKKNLSY